MAKLIFSFVPNSFLLSEINSKQKADLWRILFVKKTNRKER
ncbi:hypothetical protein [Enterococcus durans]|nr:hypothetical protein [Enterococcus durans]